MLTGDKEAIAKDIAQSIGIDDVHAELFLKISCNA
jgi:cation transport ATPase